MSVLRFTVPGPPHPKGRPRFARISGHIRPHVRTYTDPETVSYENWVCLCARKANKNAAPLLGPVAVHLVFRLQRPLSTKREHPSVKPDLDNLIKAVLDGLKQAGVWRDDAQVVRLVSSKGYGDPCCEALIEELA